MSRKPNLIYILADDMGYGDLSCLNPNSKIQTTHLDQLAADGLRCTDAHATSAVCTPSRYSILTGRYNWRSWLKQGVTFGYSGPLIEAGRLTVAGLLQKNGYATGCIGKWHLGWTWATRGPAAGNEDIDFTRPITNGPTTCGFDYFFGISASLDMPPYVYVENDRVTAQPDRIIPVNEGKAFWREGPIAPDFAHDAVLPELTQRAIRWIEQSAAAENPFFLYFPLPAPHTPILPGPEFRGRSGTNAYGDFCLQVDDVVGQIMTTLERLDLTDDTIVIFTADNGCSPAAELAELAGVGHNPSHVFRGHKADIYEGGHRIPLVVRWPARIPAGLSSDETVCLGDLLATCADILEIKLPDHAGEDSISNLPVWTGTALSETLREATVHHSIDGSFSIRRGRWKLEMCPGSGGWSYPQPGKECEGLPPIQLYDLTADIGERRNVQAENPVIVAELKALLTRYVENGRSTPGLRQGNTGGLAWEQLWWLLTRRGPQTGTAAPAPVEPERLVPYKRIGATELKLHIFHPAEQSPTETRPAIIFFFGGGWVGGSPRQFYQQARAFAAQGLVALVAEYRTDVHHPNPFHCVQDGKSAIRWVRQHAGELGIAAHQIIAAGGSAGGHVAACAAVTAGPEEAGEEMTVSSRPNAMILYNPVLDTTEKGFGFDRVGRDRQTEISPCHHVRRGIGPTLLFHGTADQTVPFENAERFTALMIQAGNSCTLVAFPGKAHGFFNGSECKPTNSDEDFQSTMERSLTFLRDQGFLVE